MLMNLLRSVSNQFQCGFFQRRNRRGHRVRLHAPALTPAMESLESRTLLSAQMISSSIASVEAQPSETIVVPVFYSTKDDAGQAAAIPAVAIGFNVHFDSQALTFMGTRNVLTENLVSAPTEVSEGAYGATVDHNSDTDSAINTAYLNIFGMLPNESATEPVMLFEAVFKVSPDFQGATEINFTRNGDSPALTRGPGFEFESQSVQVTTTAIDMLAVRHARDSKGLTDEVNHEAGFVSDAVVSPVNESPETDAVLAETVNAASDRELIAVLSAWGDSGTNETSMSERSAFTNNQEIDDERLRSTDVLDSLFSTEFANGMETETVSNRL